MHCRMKAARSAAPSATGIRIVWVGSARLCMKPAPTIAAGFIAGAIAIHAPRPTLYRLSGTQSRYIIPNIPKILE